MSGEVEDVAPVFPGKGCWLVGCCDFFSSMFHIGWNQGMAPAQGETGTIKDAALDHLRCNRDSAWRPAAGVAFLADLKDVDFPKQKKGWVTNHNGNSAIDGWMLKQHELESTSEGGCHAEPNFGSNQWQDVKHQTSGFNQPKMLLWNTLSSYHAR